MVYTSIFYLLQRSPESWEDGLTDFLVWSLARSESASSWLVEQSGLEPPFADIDLNWRKRDGEGGVPDIQVTGAWGNGRRFLIAVEVKLTAGLGAYQQDGYEQWRASRRGRYDDDRFILLAPRYRSDLMQYCHEHALKFVALQDLLAEAERAEVSIPLSELTADAGDWFLDPQVDEESGKNVLEAGSWRSWPVGGFMRALKSVVGQRLADSAIYAGNIWCGTRAGTTTPECGFHLKQGGDRVAWMGLYVWDNHLWFELILKPLAVPEGLRAELGITQDSGNPNFPYAWRPHAEHGPWRVDQLMLSGLTDVLSALGDNAQL